MNEARRLRVGRFVFGQCPGLFLPSEEHGLLCEDKWIRSYKSSRREMTKRWTAELQKPLSSNFVGGRLAVSLRNGTLTNQYHHYCVVAPKYEGDKELCSLKAKWDHHQHTSAVFRFPPCFLSLTSRLLLSRWFSAKRTVLWERLTNTGVLFSLLRRAMIKITLATKQFGLSPAMKVSSSETAEEKRCVRVLTTGLWRPSWSLKPVEAEAQ